jgi:hypothetical protein
MPECKLLAINDDGDLVEIGRIVLHDVTIFPTLSPGYEKAGEWLMASALQSVNGDVVTAQDNPKEWFEALPLNYTGTYFKAAMAEERANVS